MLFVNLLACTLSFFVQPVKLFSDTIQLMLLTKFVQLVGLSGAELTSLIGFTVVLEPIKLQLMLPSA